MLLSCRSIFLHFVLLLLIIGGVLSCVLSSRCLRIQFEFCFCVCRAFVLLLFDDLLGFGSEKCGLSPLSTAAAVDGGFYPSPFK
jgi:hypothetical protein